MIAKNKREPIIITGTFSSQRSRRQNAQFYLFALFKLKSSSFNVEQQNEHFLVKTKFFKILKTRLN